MVPSAGFSRLLVPLELDEGDEALVAHAMCVAVAYRTRLVLAHVREKWDSEDPWADAPIPRTLLVRWGLATPETARGTLRAMGVSVRRANALGFDVVEELTEIGERHEPDLLVAGTHQRHGIERLLHGSVAEALARRLLCPALFLPKGVDGFVDAETGKINLRRVLLPVGGEIDPRPTLDRAVSLMRALGVKEPEVVVLHVGDPDRAPTLPRPEGVDMTWVFREDVVSKAIIDEALGLSPDLVVMATRGHDSLFDVLVGSTTERVLRGLRCPLLSIPVGERG